MIKINNLTIKNFMSIGNVTQAITFGDDLTLVLGENLDLGANGSRNGTGKTTIINALSFALYGNALTRIKLSNLINKTNEKNMLVSVGFTKNDINYKIERGRKPNVLKLFINDQDNDAQGDSRETQKVIEDILGLTHTMFKHIVALNTTTEPFLNMKAADQRDVIEELLGITLLSEKASVLKEHVRESKDTIKQEEFKIKAITESNARIEQQIRSLEQKHKIWNTTQDEDLTAFQTAILQLDNVDIDHEVKQHKELEVYNKNADKIIELGRAIKSNEREVSTQESLIVTLDATISSLNHSKCHTCGQDLHGDKHLEMLATKEAELTTATQEHERFLNEVDTHTKESKKIYLGKKPEVFYSSLEQALNHKHSLDTLLMQLEARATEENTYTDQIESFKADTLQKINYDKINKATTLLEHQQFLLKLLTDKDSFVRKKIIDQNLKYLNSRLSYYISQIGLRHLIEFKNDLEVEITDLGKEFDFDNLSRGEKNRVILSLSWAFRDVWENLYTPINLLFVDEVIDSGMDDAGVENCLTILKGMARNRNKSVWLITHRNELISRVNNVLHVTKENGFTSFSKNE